MLVIKKRIYQMKGKPEEISGRRQQYQNKKALYYFSPDWKNVLLHHPLIDVRYSI